MNDSTLTVELSYPNQRWALEAAMNLIRCAMNSLSERDEDAPELTTLEVALLHIGTVEADRMVKANIDRTTIAVD